MCGASQQQTQIGDAQLAAYQQANQLTQDQYKNQQEIFKPLAAQFQSIFDLGKNQKGFSDEERNTLNAQAVEGTAQNYQQAARAVGENLAARGGGDEFMPSGGADQLKSEVAQSAAQQISNQETQIKTADYSKGYTDWLNAGQGLEAIAAGENPLGYQSNATSAGGAASVTANDIASQDNSWINAALGAAGAIGAGAVSRRP